MRTAKTLEESWELKSPLREGPHGSIQWKGTDVCIDIHCVCGCHSHFDGDFMYSIQCPRCKRNYAADSTIELILLEEQPDDVQGGFE